MRSVTLLLDPRFPGGTSSAVAREIHALAPVVNLTVVALQSRMFKGDRIHPLILAACEETGTNLSWAGGRVSDDIVVLHNPACLKFNTSMPIRIFCDRLFVVCHENFLRPTGVEAFDVAHCLSLIRQASVARELFLAPVSAWNRACIDRWLADTPTRWTVTDHDWTNICDFQLQSPPASPRDRRGRHSRPGFEKFPSLGMMRDHFPATCDAVRILGADSFLGDPELPPHWDCIRFGGEDVDGFLRSIDFFVYFTNPCWRESFGRVIGEAIAAGRVVITDPGTAQIFGDGVVASDGHDVDDIVRRLIDDPAQYHAIVARGQAKIAEFGRSAFLDRFDAIVPAAETRPPPYPQSMMEALDAVL